MSEPKRAAEDATDETRDLDFEQARLAYSIISALLEHTRVVSDLVETIFTRKLARGCGRLWPSKVVVARNSQEHGIA